MSHSLYISPSQCVYNYLFISILLNTSAIDVVAGGATGDVVVDVVAHSVVVVADDAVAPHAHDVDDADATVDVVAHSFVVVVVVAADIVVDPHFCWCCC